MAVDFTAPAPPAPSAPAPVPTLPLVSRLGEAPPKPKKKLSPFVFVFGRAFEVYDLAGAPFIAPRLWRRALTDGSNGVVVRFDKDEGRNKYNLEAFHRNLAVRGLQALGWETGYLKPLGVVDSYAAAWDTIGPDGDVLHTVSSERAFVDFVRSQLGAGNLPAPTEADIVALRARLQRGIDACGTAHRPSDYQVAELAFVQSQINAIAGA